MKKALAFLPVLLFLSACSHMQKGKAIVYENNGNKIIFCDPYISDYLTAVKNDYANKDKDYKDIVMDPIHDAYLKDIPKSDKETYSSMADTNGLSERVSAIAKNRGKIEQIITASLATSEKYLKTDDLNIIILPPTNMPTTMKGVVGGALNKNEFFLGINPTLTGWDTMLKCIIAFSCNMAHYMQEEHPDITKTTILSYMVTVGKAGNYAHMLCPTITAVWDTALSKQGVSDLWARIQDDLNKRDPTLTHYIMYGNGDYPQWGGYCLGYNIVQSALKNNPNLTPEQWTDMTPEQILKLSDYK